MNNIKSDERGVVNIVVAILLVIVIIGSGIFFWLNKRSEKANEPKLIEVNKEVEEVGSADEFLEEMNPEDQGKGVGSEIYEDKLVGFSFQYPGEILLMKVGEQLDREQFFLTVTVDKITGLVDMMGYDKETALKNQASLAKGEYGEEVDWSLSDSKVIRNLGEVNGQDFVVFGRFEVCDVVFERKLIFYKDGYQVVITLNGPRKDILDKFEPYFTVDEENCGLEKKWSVIGQAEFYEDLVAGNLDGAAQDWSAGMDEIIETLKFN